MTPISLAARRHRGLARQQVRSQPIRNHRHACAAQKVDRARARDRHLGAEERNRQPRSDAGRLCGIALAVAPNEAAYLPLGHREASEGETSGLFAAKLCDGQISEQQAFDALKPILEDQSIVKVGHDVKRDWLVLACRGIRVGALDDVMLMSYALDAGKGGHDMDALGSRYLGRSLSRFTDVKSKERALFTPEATPIARAAGYAAEDADLVLRLWQALKPRMAAERVMSVYETLERPMPAVLARMEERGISIDPAMLAKLSNDFGKEQAALEQEINEIAGTPVNRRLAQAAGRHPVRQDGPARRLEDQDRAMVDRRARIGGAGRGRPRAAAQDSGLAAGVEAALDLYRGAAQLRQPDHAARAHQLCAGGDLDRAAVVVGAEFAEHPDPHRRRPQDPQGLRRRARQEAGVGRLFADRIAAAVGSRRGADAAAGVQGRRRHPRHDRVRDVRRAGQGHAGRHPPPRQGDQFRHHLRHLGLRARQPARDRARGSRRLHQEIFRALPRHPRLHGRDARILPRQGLRAHAVRAQVSLPGHQELQPLDPLVQRARGDQRAAARHAPPTSSAAP